MASLRYNSGNVCANLKIASFVTTCVFSSGWGGQLEGSLWHATLCWIWPSCEHSLTINILEDTYIDRKNRQMSFNGGYLRIFYNGYNGRIFVKQCFKSAYLYIESEYFCKV